MSYEKDNSWCQEIVQGIESVLGESCQITYHYMDTKINFSGGEKRAGEAYALYQKLRPDGVIAADDNAQAMFVVPHLKDKVDTPVMFCGVNADAEKYGYPSTNISGVLERGHVRESLAFIKQLLPSTRSVSFVAKDSPSGMALRGQVESEMGTYLAKVAGFHLVKDTKELVELGGKLNETSDAVFIDSLEGIVDKQRGPLTNRELIGLFAQAYKGPIIGANKYHIDQGALSAVVKTGQEQGGTAARLLLDAMRGAPVSELPITRNYRGKRVINVTVMKALGIEPRPIVLRGAQLVTTEP